MSVIDKVIDDWKYIGQSLASSGRSQCKDIFVLHHERDTLSLDRRHFFESVGSQNIQNGFFEGCRPKWEQFFCVFHICILSWIRFCRLR